MKRPNSDHDCDPLLKRIREKFDKQNPETQDREKKAKDLVANLELLSDRSVMKSFRATEDAVLKKIDDPNLINECVLVSFQGSYYRKQNELLSQLKRSKQPKLFYQQVEKEIQLCLHNLIIRVIELWKEQHPIFDVSRNGSCTIRVEYWNVPNFEENGIIFEYQ